MLFRSYFLCDVFFNYTATTEIYTSCHPLSLRDALPIWARRRRLRRPSRQPFHLPRRAASGRRAARDAPRRSLPLPRHAHVGRPLGRLGPRSRSEEHTSELQSLMRSSYAVFCLKKKKKTSEIQTIHSNK